MTHTSARLFIFLRSVEMEGAAAEAPGRRRRVPLGQLPNALKSEPAQLDTVCELELECDETAESLETCVTPRPQAPHYPSQAQCFPTAAPSQQCWKTS